MDLNVDCVLAFVHLTLALCPEPRRRVIASSLLVCQFKVQLYFESVENEFAYLSKLGLNQSCCQVRQHDENGKAFDTVSFPLDDHVHLCKPCLHELVECMASLAKLSHEDTLHKVSWLIDEHSIDVGDKLLEE